MATVNVSNSLVHSTGAYCLSAGCGGSHMLVHTDYVCIPTLCTSGTANFNNLTVAGNLTVQGTTTTLNTTTCTTSAMSITNAGTGPALVVNQTGTQPVVNLQDDGTSVFYIEDGGNVGIGTTNPGSPLDICNSIASGVVCTQLTLRTYNPDFIGACGGNGILFKNQDSNNSTNEGCILAITRNDTCFGDNDEANTSFVFRMTNGGTAQDNVIFTGDGRVGIGTTNPSSTLTVAGDARLGDGNKLYLYNSNNVNYLAYNKWQVQTSTALAINNDGTGGFQIQDSGTAVLFVGTDSTYGGRVGIGTTQPATLMHLYDNVDPDDTYGYLQIQNANTTTGSAATNAGLTLKNYHGTSQFMQWEELGVRIGSRITTNSGAGDLYFTTDNDSVGMCLIGNHLCTAGCVVAGSNIYVGGDCTDFGGSVTYLRSSNEFAFLNGTAAQNARFKGIQVSDSYSGTVPNCGILFGTDTCLLRSASGQLEMSSTANSTLLNIRSKNAGCAMVRAGLSTDGSQATGAFEVTQDGSYGGGMSYNGDSSPAFASGETSDHVTFYNLNAGTRTEVFHYAYNSTTVNFNATPTVGGCSVWHAGNDGCGSGLNADTVDNLHGTQFLRQDVSTTKVGNLNFTSNNACLTLCNYGRIGIGMTDPQNPLEVCLGDNSTFTNGIVFVKNSGNRGTRGHSSGSALFQYCFCNCAGMILNKDGNVGIAEATPLAKLHIRTVTGTDTPGNINSHIMFDVADDGGPAWAMRLGDTADDGDFNIDRRTGGTWSNVINLDRATGKTYIKADAHITSSTNSWDGGLQMLSQDGTDLYCIHPDNNGYMYVNKNWCFNDGDLKFGKSNPYLCASSYIIMPGGLYVSGGTAYFSNRTMHRGGICNDSGTYLQIDGGTCGDTYFPNQVGIGTTDPGSCCLQVQGNSKIVGKLHVTAAINLCNSNLCNANHITINDPGTYEGLAWNSTAGNWVIDVSPLGRTNADGNLNFYNTGSNNIALWRPQLWVYDASNYATGTANSDGSLTITSTNTGADIFSIEGSNGTLFSVADDLSDSLMSVNDAAGLPVLEVFADSSVCAGRYSCSDFYIASGGNIGIGTDSPDANHDLTIANNANYGIRLTGTNGTIYSNTNLIEGAANNIYLRPGSAYCTIIDTGCGLRVTSGYVCTTGAVYACQFVDRDNTSCLVNPSATSYLNALCVNGGFCVGGNSCLGNGNGDWVHVNDKLHVGATDSGDACLQFGEGSTANLSWGVDWNWDSAYTFAWHARCSGSNRNLVWGYNVSTDDYLCTGRCINMCNNSIHEINELAFTDSFRICDTGQSNKIFFCSGSASSVKLELGTQTSGRGSLYANNGNCVGILDEGGDWAIIHSNNSYTAFRDSGGTERLCIGTAQVKSNEPFCIAANWSDGTEPEQLTIQGCFPSLALRSTNAGTGNVNLIHVNSSGNLDFYSTPTTCGASSDNWTKRACISTSGNVWAQTALYAGSSGALRQISGDYGSIEVDGGASGGWEGYSIGGRAVFMHNNSCATGIYNDVNNEWLFCAAHNGEAALLYDGTKRIYTTGTGACIAQSSGDPGLQITGTGNEKINLSGSTNPYIRFEEGTNDKAYIQWHGGNGELKICNQEDSRGIVINSDLCFYNGTGNCTVWHSGNDGASSGLDADLLDGQHGSYYARKAYWPDVTTQLGCTAHGLTDLNTEALWSKPAGYQTMVRAACSSGLPSNHGQSYFGYTVTSRRDTGGGYSALLTAYDNSELWFTYQSSCASYPTWRRIWHDNNDGSGSGLDADTVDGTHASGFLLCTGMPNNTDTWLNFRVIRNANSSSSNDGMYIGYCNTNSGITRLYGGGSNSNYSYIASNGCLYHDDDSIYWNAGNDGSGSGLDADLLDGYHQTSFVRLASSSSSPTNGNFAIGNASSRNFIQSHNSQPLDLNPLGNTVTIGGTSNTAWHAGNDGASSGLDADLLDGQHGSYYQNASNLNAGTYPDLFSCTTRYCIGLIDGNNTSSRDKLRVYGSSSYTIGMQSGITFGCLNDWSMTFQMNNESDRGFWWGDTGHTTAQGAMSLTTHGYLTVANRIRVGAGESFTGGPSYNLQVDGTAYISSSVYVPHNIYHIGDTNTYYGFHGSDRWRVVTGGTERIEIANTATVINDGGTSHDLRVEACSTSTGPLGNKAYALFVDASAGAVGIGTSQPSYALEVNGTAFVTGTFSAGTKNFLIDHPTKENYMLRHGSLEGPENAVYVRGTTTSSSIELPEYWTGLVDEDSITATLTPRGKYLQLFLDRVEDNEIHVGGTEIGELYDYVVYGTRKDVEDLVVEFERPVGS